jgi:hypothetical protein
MNQKAIIAIVLVAILAVAAIAAARMLTGGDKSSDEEKYLATGNLTVLGNADNDNKLTDHDIEIINDIIKAGVWNKKAYPLADANNDGVVNESDISYLKNLMKGKNATPTKMYYYNTWNEIGSVRFPVTGNIGTMYWEQADLAILLGLWDRVKAVGSGSLSEEKNPGWQSLYSYGKGYNAEPEVVAKSYEAAGVTAVIAYIQGDGTAKDIDAYLKGTNSKIDLLCLPTSMNGRVVTAGVLLCCEEQSEKYMKYYDEVMAYVQDKIGNVKDAPSCVTVMMRSTTTTADIRFLNMSTTGESNGLYTYMLQSPSEVYIVEPTNSYATHTDIEWLNSKNPDWIIFCSSGAWTTGNTQEQNMAQFKQECDDIFSSTTAYKNKHIVATANGTMNSFFGCFAYPKLLSYLYDEIEDDYADKMVQAFFDEKFAYYTLDNMPSYQFYSM